MALKKTTTTTTTNFETEPEMTAVIDKPETQPDATVSAVTTIAKAAATSLSTNDAAQMAKKFKAEVTSMKGAADFGYGSHIVVKADNGVLKEMAGDKMVFGRWMKVRLLAWDYSYQVSPGEQGKDSGQYVAYSKDGKVIDHVIGDEYQSWIGKPVADYVEFLRKEEEFDKAGVREFIDTECAVLGSEDEPSFRGVVQITLSASSIPAFRKYQSDLEGVARCVSMGLEGFSLPADPFTMFMVREAASRGSQTWTKIKILSSLPAKI